MSVTEHKILPTAFSTESAQRALSLARQTLQIEADAILALKTRMSDSIDEPLARAVALLLECEGRVVVSGIGKSGHIGRKIAATFASTGTPALFMHPYPCSMRVALWKKISPVRTPVVRLVVAC